MDEKAPQTPDTDTATPADGYDAVIKRAIANAEARPDTPLNGGFGVELDDFEPSSPSESGSTSTLPFGGSPEQRLAITDAALGLARHGVNVKIDLG